MDTQTPSNKEMLSEIKDMLKHMKDDVDTVKQDVHYTKILLMTPKPVEPPPSPPIETGYTGWRLF